MARARLDRVTSRRQQPEATRVTAPTRVGVLEVDANAVAATITSRAQNVAEPARKRVIVRVDALPVEADFVRRARV